METDGSQFVVDPGGTGEIVSVDDLERAQFPGPARFQRVDGDVASLLVAPTLVSDTDDSINQAAGIWRHGSISDQTLENTNSGVFAWGIASSQATLDALNAGQVTASFLGHMSGNTQTAANITINFGSQPNWSGNWQNPAYAFDAGGSVTGVDLVSDPKQFSANVLDGYVQGALVGEGGNQAVAHAIDVVLGNGSNGDLIVKDVGLLQHVPVTISAPAGVR